VAVDDRAQIGDHPGERIGRIVELVEADPITAVFEPLDATSGSMATSSRAVPSGHPSHGDRHERRRAPVATGPVDPPLREGSGA
jgi:hypothetical protein